MVWWGEARVVRPKGERLRQGWARERELTLPLGRWAPLGEKGQGRAIAGTERGPLSNCHAGHHVP
jgi:hypothetical protein